MPNVFCKFCIRLHRRGRCLCAASWSIYSIAPRIPPGRVALDMLLHAVFCSAIRRSALHRLVRECFIDQEMSIEASRRLGRRRARRAFGMSANLCYKSATSDGP